MDFNISFKLNANTIEISKIKKSIDKSNLNNTNVINLKELKFSTSYIEENKELVSSFLNVTIIKYNITTCVINSNDIAVNVLSLINTWEHIKKIIFKEKKSLSFDIFMRILDNRYIEEIECEHMDKYLIERLDVNKSIVVKTRSKIENTSSFMIINSLKSFSDIYYKKYIIVNASDDLEEIKTFINLNNKLKVIKIIKYSNELLTTILNEIILNKKRNIKIEIDKQRFKNDI